jgi:Holliday junction resolvase-like predicted endonuclease
VADGLRAQGWTILARNVRVARSEVDIIAVESEPTATLVFVEVRSRTVTRYGAPEESVDAAKVERLYRAAWRLVREGSLPDGRPLPRAPMRIDLVTVVRDGLDRPWVVCRHLRGLRPP